MHIKSFFDELTSTFTYVISDEQTKKCVIIDPVLDYDAASGKISKRNADHLLEYISQQKFNLEWILETHVHADHLTAAYYLREMTGAKIGIGQHILKVLKTWHPIFNFTTGEVPMDGSQFDQLFQDGDEIKVGNFTIHVMHTPGHTPACVTYIIDNNAFVGDTIFMPHMGTARCDFPGGSAKELYESIQKIYALGDYTNIFVGHDYPKQGIQEEFKTTVLEQKKNNIMIHELISDLEFIKLRESRDKTLNVPKLLLPSLQINLRAGKLPAVEDNKIAYIKIPINQL